MYHYSAARKSDAIRHAIDANGETVRCGDATLAFDRIYGWVEERRAGRLVARHLLTLDPQTGQITDIREQVL